MKKNATIAARNRPAVDPRLSYALVNRDKPLFVRSINTGVIETPQIARAMRFEGKWLADTCWSWQMFWVPVEWNQAQARYKTETKKSSCKTKPKPLLKKRASR